MRIFYSTNYVGSGHDFDTTRKARWIADSLVKSPIAGIDLVEPVPLAGRQVTEVHDPEYVRSARLDEDGLVDLHRLTLSCAARTQ